MFTSKINFFFFEISLLPPVLSSFRSGFVILKLDYALAYPGNKLGVSAASQYLLLLKSRMTASDLNCDSRYDFTNKCQPEK